jgi:hypothetical protein
MIRAGTQTFQYIAFLPAWLVCPSLLMVGFVNVENEGFIGCGPLTLGVACNIEIMQRFCCTQHLFFARLWTNTIPFQT